MQLPSTPGPNLPSSSRAPRLLCVLVVGPELLSRALHALLSAFDDISVLSPISEMDRVLPFLRCIGSAQPPVDAIVLYWSGDRESDRALLTSLCEAGQRCLVVTSLYFPEEVEFIKSAGAWGLFSAASHSGHLVTALRTIARGQKYFAELFPNPPKQETPRLTKPRILVFHEERLKALAQEIMWELNQTELAIFRYFTTPRIDGIADKINLSPATVRRELSERVYEFLKLISGHPVPNRFVALQVLQEYGIIEYVLDLPST